MSLTPHPNLISTLLKVHMRQASVTLLTACLIPFAPLNRTLAQSITAAPDGTGTIINYNGSTYLIQGGTQAGTNLFHSFQEFGLSSGEIANFLSNPSITNIFGRVTGGNASIIDGLIQANPNLYLMNPAGIVFGANASLNVGGDFFATTADQICFEGGCFNSVGVNDYNALLGSPTSLGFLQAQPGGLVNAGILDVLKGKSIHLIGGTVVNLGQILTPGGMATVAAIPGERRVSLNQPGNLLSLEVTEAVLTEGLDPLALPELLTGSSTPLTDQADSANQGDVVIGGTVQGAQVNVYAAGQVTPTDDNWVQSDAITVVRYPQAGDALSYNFIDALIDDPESFLYGGEPGSISTLIGSQENGIDVITERLDDLASEGITLDGVRIVAEGNEGNFWLGNAWVTDESIHDYSEQLATWSDALTESADLLLYSCFTALGATGEALVSSIANLTGTDVAASTNLTGNADLGGDWVLEHQLGTIELGLGFEPGVVENYEGKLAVFTATNAASLIAAIATANGNGQADTINLASNITLTAVNNATDGANGLPSVVADGGNKVTINGMGNTIRSGGNFRIFQVAAGAELEINETTLTGGVANAGGSGDDGGAIFNRGTLTVNNSTISGNSAADDGGAIQSFNASANIATVTLTNTTVASNTAGGNGGGLSNTTFTNAAANSAVMNIINSTVSNNTANVGGGVASLGQNANNSAVVNITNSTISGNTVVFGGGGIYNRGQTATRGSTVVIANSTIVNNVVTNPGSSAGGIINLNVGGGANTALVTVVNSIVAQNTATVHPDVRRTSATNAPITDLGNNLIGIDSQGLFTTSTLVGTTAAPLDPLLGPLTITFGPTATHDLLTGSPALNAGDNSVITLSTDQRGLVRIFNGTVDIGAVEWQPLPVTAASVTFDDPFEPREEKEHLLDELLESNNCQTILEVELDGDDEVIEEELAATEEMEMYEACLPID
ncbi:MAG: DUF4347 domain-containing protein [Spirulinaceae cyanobacterium]